MKKTLSALLLCIAGMLFPINTYADGEAPADFTGHTWYEYRQEITEGQGSMTDPIVISTPGQLAQLAYNVNTGTQTYENKVVALTADIDLNKEVDGQRVQWVPIGCNSENYFKGLFIGMDLKDYAANGFKTEQKHKISGMYINVTSASTVKQFGLFGFLGGNVSHLQLEDYSIIADLSAHATAENIYIGGVCGNTIDASSGSGAWYRGTFLENNGDSRGAYINFAIDDASVSGSITVNGGNSATVSVGGICGRFGNYGIIHSTANVTINVTDCLNVGGICGINSGKYTSGLDEGKCLYDCVANADITFGYTRNFASGPENVGGIVGQMEKGEEAYACVSMGSIKYRHDTERFQVLYNIGGVCGQMQPMASLFACGSTMLIKSYGYVGGIVGQMKKGDENDFPGYKHSKVECCSFSGHLDASDKILDDKGQTTGIRTTRPSYNHVGGLCGNMEWDADDGIERITRCLMTGTLNSEDYNGGNMKPSATVGIVGRTSDTSGTEGNPAGNYLYTHVTYCYYDTNLFSGYAIPESYDGGQSVKGLTTEELTSGDMNKVTWLNPSDTESDKYGYRVEKGYYPIFYENKGSNASYYWGEYNSKYYSNVNLANLFFRYEDGVGKVNMYSTVYASGALLCAMPVKFVKGDCADDFVSTMSAPTKTYNWEEKLTGRNIIMTCESFFPESDVIRVKDKTATAFNNGTCFVTTTATVRKKTVTYNRPAIMGGTKYLGLNTTIDKEWDGSEADGFAAGTGTAGDPYLIKNAAQLYHAIKKNATGQFYKQLCNITITKSVNTDNSVNNTLITEACFKTPANPQRHVTADWQTDECSWKANYNGDGHTISGLYLYDYYSTTPTRERRYFSLFGYVGQYGSVNNLAVVDAWIAPEPSVINGINTNYDLPTFYGIIANYVEGSITNCIAQGVNAVGRPCGGICTYVMSGGTVEDCISAVTPLTTTSDYFTPFVANIQSGTDVGTVKNCLAVSPTMFSSADKSTNNLSAVKDCYWLKGYEPGNTGQTLDEIGAALGSRDRWTWSHDYFPTLKTFANTDIAKLMMVPVRTDNNYEFNTSTSTANNYLMGFTKMLEFEPGAATWTNLHNTNYFEADSELGIVAPANAMGAISTSDVMINPMEVICASLNKSFYYIPLRTNSGDVERGITFVDPHAEAACVAAFDTDHDGRLSLQEISAVTTEQTLTAFNSTDVQLEAQQIVKFPEFRFFKAVTNLTSQLSGLSNLEEVRLPYNLQTISGDPSLTGNGTRPFSMTNIKSITLPAKVTTIEPGAFYSEFSEIDSIFVDPFNTHFESREGILFDNNNALVAYPNGRSGEEIIIPGVIEEIKPGAIYQIPGLQKVFFDTTDYTTVADLKENGIFTGDGSLVDVYISDATYGSILYNEYLEDDSWTAYANADKLHCYYPLKIGSAKAATMYIGFDTELPEGLRSYIVESDSYPEEAKAYLKKTSNQIPNRSPIVVFADAPGTYRLFPLEEQLEPWKMFTNLLNGVGRDGMEVYQSDADRGSILTLGRNSKGELGFFYYKGTVPIPPYRAYLTYEWVADANQYLLFSIVDDDPTGITQHPTPDTQQQDWYTLDGRRINGQPAKRGIYIRGGKKYVVK